MLDAAQAASAAQGAAWGALATAVAALVALVVGIVTVVQKSRADKRAEWWRRSQWAIEQTNSPVAQVREAGLIVLLTLIDSPLATEAEQRMLLDVGSNLERRTAGGSS